MSLHAVVLAGGYGTRMRPLTQRRPKHLLPIGDEPVIAHQLHRLAAAGVDTVVLATSYHAEAFEPALGAGEAYGLRLRYVRESSPLGTGGALHHACDAMALDHDDDVLVLNGDLISTHDLGRHVARHRAWQREASDDVLVSVHGRPVTDAGAFGLMHLSDDALVTLFEEKPAGHPAGVVNAGTYVMTPAAIAQIPPDVETSLERQLFPDLCAQRRVRAHVEDAIFADIGTPASLLDANIAWARERGADAVVLSSAVAPDAVVTNSLVMRGARVARATITDSILAPGAVIGEGAEVVRCVVGDDAVIAPGARLHDDVVDVAEHRP